MNKIQKMTTFILLLAFLLLPANSAYAKGLLDGRVIFGDNFTLDGGDALTGDLVVFGGNVTIESEAVIEGDMVVIGGNVTMDGTVEGSAVIIGGSMNMGETSIIEGDLVTVGGSLQRDSGSQVEGDVISNIPAPDFQIPDFQVPDVPAPPSPPSPPSPPNPMQPNLNVNFNPLVDFLQMLVTAVAIALLAMLGSLFLQPQIERVAQTIVKQPVIAGSFGLMTSVLAPIVLIILAVTIILIPVVILAAAVLALAWLFGIIAIGFEVGDRFTKAINQTWAVPLVSGFGTLLMMLVVGGIGMIPCVGWFVPFLVALLGIGGVTLTLFGTRPYPRVVLPPE
jgi:cytoskeletal protein CcmA (bactofilin family)